MVLSVSDKLSSDKLNWQCMQRLQKLWWKSRKNGLKVLDNVPLLSGDTGIPFKYNVGRTSVSKASLIDSTIFNAVPPRWTSTRPSAPVSSGLNMHWLRWVLPLGKLVRVSGLLRWVRQTHRQTLNQSVIFSAMDAACITKQRKQHKPHECHSECARRQRRLCRQRADRVRWLQGAS